MMWLMVALGGAVGAVLRFAVARQWSAGWPAATWLVNVVGSLGLAWLVTVQLQRPILSEPLRLGITAGLFGALTTYSTFNLEVLEMMRDGRPVQGLVYLGATVFGCGLGGALGMWLGGVRPG
jgi:CrcB protein